MKMYRIKNSVSGAILGVFQGETPEDARKAMHLDAGSDYSDWDMDMDDLIYDEVEPMTYHTIPEGLLEEVMDIAEDKSGALSSRGHLESMARLLITQKYPTATMDDAKIIGNELARVSALWLGF